MLHTSQQRGNVRETEWVILQHFWTSLWSPKANKKKPVNNFFKISSVAAKKWQFSRTQWIIVSPAHPSQSSVPVCFQPSFICFIWTQILSLFAENRVHTDAFAQPCYHRVHCLVHATILLDGVCWYSLVGSQVIFSCSVTKEKNYCNILYLHCVLLTLERK